MSGPASSRHAAAVTMAIAILLGAGCVRLDEEHCIVNGGDFACDDGRLCVTDIDRRTEPSDEGDGCVLEDQVDETLEDHFVRVQYGLPRSLGSNAKDAEAAMDDTQSVVGVLFLATAEREVDEVCAPDEDITRSFEPQWRAVFEVREFLERPTRVRASSAGLSPEQVEAIEAFDAAINEWLEECEAATIDR